MRRELFTRKRIFVFLYKHIVMEMFFLSGSLWVIFLSPSLEYTRFMQSKARIYIFFFFCVQPKRRLTALAYFHLNGMRRFSAYNIKRPCLTFILTFYLNRKINAVHALNWKLYSCTTLYDIVQIWNTTRFYFRLYYVICCDDNYYNSHTNVPFE